MCSSDLLTGLSRLRIAGAWVVVDGLTFTNGYVSSGDVIGFQETTFNLASFSRITNCAIIHYNPPNGMLDTKWVSLYGFSNRVENCYFVGKTNLGTTLVVWVDTDANKPGYHYVGRNYFGPRPPLGVNGGEAIRVGTSDVSLNNSRTTVEYNFFERYNGDAEIISSKSCENVYRFNTFVECEGALSLRHGNRCTVEGNFFFGGLKPLTGGVRVVGEDHLVYNNYFADLTGTSARSPVSIMQGLVNTPLSGYALRHRVVGRAGRHVHGGHAGARKHASLRVADDADDGSGRYGLAGRGPHPRHHQKAQACQKGSDLDHGASVVETHRVRVTFSSAALLGSRVADPASTAFHLDFLQIAAK